MEWVEGLQKLLLESKMRAYLREIFRRLIPLKLCLNINFAKSHLLLSKVFKSNMTKIIPFFNKKETSNI